MSSETENVLGVFLQEGSDQLEELEALLLELEERPDDREVLRRFMGLAHTFKGSAGTTGLGGFADLMHEVEGVADLLRKDRLAPTPQLFNRLLEALDGLRRGLAALARGETDARPLAEAGVALRDFARDAAGAEPAAAAASALPELGVRLREYDLVRMHVLQRQGKRLHLVTFPSGDPAPAVPPRALVQVVRGLGVLIASEPAEHLLDDAPPGAELRCLVATERPSDELRAALADAGRGAPVVTAVHAAPGAPAQAGTRPEVHDTLKVDVQRVDRLMEMVGELVIVEAMVANAPELTERASRQLRSSLGQLTKISLDLQDAAMCMRMVPVRLVFRKMERLVRDLGTRSGKQVQLVQTGAGTEVDRGIADRLADPLVHLIRNAIDHGLEPPDERRQAGKRETGTIELSAAHEAGVVVVRVVDDGRGLDRDAVLDRARATGLVGAGRTSDADLLGCLFEPGFSTARAVTELSGRGVGLDVVKRSVEAMRGRVSVESRRGAGTRFTLVLPLTLAIINGTLVRCGRERFVVPTLSILECLPLEAGKRHEYAGGVELLEVRGCMLPILRLERVLGVEGDPIEQPLVLVVESVGRRVGLIVDDVLVQQQVVIKGIESPLCESRFFSGAAILPDGRVGLILNVDQLSRLPAHLSGVEVTGPQQPQSCPPATVST